MNHPISLARYLFEHQRAEMGPNTSTRQKRSLYVIPLRLLILHQIQLDSRWRAVLPAASPAVRATSRSRRGTVRPPGVIIPGADSARSVARRALGSRCRTGPAPDRVAVSAVNLRQRRRWHIRRYTSAECDVGEYTSSRLFFLFC